MASLTDKITDVRNGARPVSARVVVARNIAGTILNCNSLTGWPTASKVHFVTYQIDANSNPIEGTQLDCYGIVSGANITNVTVVDGTDGGNNIGDVVEMLPTAAWGQDLADALTKEHDRDGSHNSTAFANFASAMFPVGSIYTNAAVSTNPSTLLGFGTWVEFGTGKVLVGVDTGQTEFNTLGKSGGSKYTQAHTHGPGTLAVYANVATSAANQPNLDDWAGANSPVTATHIQAGNIEGVTASYGSGNSENLQPYITVYMWRRIA